MKQEMQEYSFELVNFKVVAFAFRNPMDFQISKVGPTDINWHVTVGIGINGGTQRLGILTKARAVIGQQVQPSNVPTLEESAIVFEFLTEFNTQDFGDFVSKKSFDIPKDIAMQLMKITMDSACGALSVMLTNSEYKWAILPVIDLDNLLGSFQDPLTIEISV